MPNIHPPSPEAGIMGDEAFAVRDRHRVSSCSDPLADSPDRLIASLNSIGVETDGEDVPFVHSGPSELPSDSYYLPHIEDRIRRKLRYYFMNPIEKWQAKGRLPWKLGLQVIKIVFVTIQLALFGMGSYKHQQQYDETTSALRHLFLLDWDSAREIAAYPPTSGPYSVYTKTEFYTNIDNVVKAYANITRDTIGTFGYDNADGTMAPLQFCKTYYRKGQIFPFNQTLNFDNTIDNACIEIAPLYPAEDPYWELFSLEAFLKSHNMSIVFDRLIEAKLKFALKTVFLKSLSKFDTPDCLRFRITVKYDNTRHDGQIIIDLDTIMEKLECHGSVRYANTDKLGYTFRQILNIIVIVLCCFSCLLCSRSLYKGHVLRRETVLFFRRQYGRYLPFHEQVEFVDGWYVMIIVNDLLIIIGSALKIQMEQKITDGYKYSTCSILLGVGNLLVWVGVLRYLGFFQKYNILILTLKRALPSVLRFMLCAVLLYAGFCFCGWVVLGPFHIKFRSLSSTSECLFALLNGDDMYATFAIMDTDSSVIWWFSRLYLYLFISLFIYVVLSLFISVLMDAYETIKVYHDQGFPLSELQAFIAECIDDVSSGLYRQESDPNLCDLFTCLRCCKKKHEYDLL